jgi:hypothetical protein
MLYVQPLFLTKLSVGVCRCTSVTQFYHPGIITDRSTAARFVSSISLCSMWVTSSVLPLLPSFLHQRQSVNIFTCFLLNLWSVLSTYTISKFLKKKTSLQRPNVFIAVVNYCVTKHVTTWCGQNSEGLNVTTYRLYTAVCRGNNKRWKISISLIFWSTEQQKQRSCLSRLFVCRMESVD